MYVLTDTCILIFQVQQLKFVVDFDGTNGQIDAWTHMLTSIFNQ